MWCKSDKHNSRLLMKNKLLFFLYRWQQLISSKKEKNDLYKIISQYVFISTSSSLTGLYCQHLVQLYMCNGYLESFSPLRTQFCTLQLTKRSGNVYSDKFLYCELFIKWLLMQSFIFISLWQDLNQLFRTS
jgi:hypothetical protein